MGFKKTTMKNIKKLAVCLLVLGSISLNACGKGDIKQEFQKEITASNSFHFTTTDSIIKGSIVFIVPGSMNKLLSNIINSDIDQTVTDNDYGNSVITYKIMKSTNYLVSVVKSVYKEDDGAPRGFFLWDECLNYFQFYDKLYVINYGFDDDYSLQIRHLQEGGILDSGCEDAGLKEKTDLSFYLRDTSLFLLNPIASPLL